MTAHPSIDFKAIASAALSSAEVLLGQWLPGGVVESGEYKALNPLRADARKGSFSINISTGAWADFATDDKGGDLVSLYAYLNGCDQVEAAKAVAGLVGIALEPSSDGGSPASSQPPPLLPATNTSPKAAAEFVGKRKKSPWLPILPVPDDAIELPKAHSVRGRPERVWTYRDADGRELGYVFKFTSSSGEKVTLPLCWCENKHTKKRAWRWCAFPEPRPLYGLDRLALYHDLPVVLVEGEKCADAPVELLGKKYVFISWPGGSKAVKKIDWRPLIGRKIIAWADCDAQREKLSVAEKDAGVDPLSKPLLPEAKQPGMRAMLTIRDLLLDLDHDIDFKLVNIPKPSEKESGWDIADAVAEGMDRDALKAFITQVHKPPAKRKQDSKPSRGLMERSGQIVSCLANIHDVLEADPEWDGVLGFNEFSYVISKIKPPPFAGAEVGEWDANDDVQTAMWITREYGFAPSPPQVTEAVEALAKSHGFHPVRDYLNSLTWDGTSRVDDWVTDFIGAPKDAYTMRVSRWFLMGMVARVMDPGVKFDCCLVLEGDQGRKKSSMLRVLAGEWFGDTDLDLHNKDAMASIRGKWLYEFAELGSLARSESTRQKSFLSRQVDQFRPPYARHDIHSPRQLVFGGSTNEWAWNKDETGGRRFWPVVCTSEIDCDGLALARDQLFAEAYSLYKAGKRFWPTADEQKKIFDPEQLKRHQADGYIDYLDKWVSERYDLFPLADAAHHLKIDPARLTRDIQTRIGKALRSLGCVRVEKRTNLVSRYWYKPPERSEATSETGDKIEDDDYVPF